VPRDTTTPRTDALDAVLNAVADLDANRWLEALLTRGEAAAVRVGGRQEQTEASKTTTTPRRKRR
jgi:hypothetical protein